jgi:bile acid:Na+ symporter, BASS family
LAIRHIERHFWIFLCISVLAGFIFPSVFIPFEGMVLYLVMSIIFLLFLKIDILDVITHIKKPLLLIYICFFNLLVTPLIVYLLFKSFGADIHIGFVLLAALPSGVSSAAFTDVMKGKTSLTMTIIILSNLISIFSIPLIFGVFFKHEIQIDSISMFIDLFKVFFIPFVVAKVVKRIIFKDLVEKLQGHYNAMIIFLLCFMITISISFQSEIILQNYQFLIKTLGLLYVLFFILQLLGYFSVAWLKKGDKLAVSNASMIMNNILGIVLALAFFGPEVVTIVILSLIPWNTMIIAKHWYKRYLP